MFRVRQMTRKNWFIMDACGHLHSDGKVLDSREYWPTEEEAQAVLDKFYPKPKHVWEHGDVFLCEGCIMIYMNPKYCEHGPQVFYIGTNSGYSDLDASDLAQNYIKHAKFLYNIKEKI